MRIGLDLCKAHHPDGIGTWQRHMAMALARELGTEPNGPVLQAMSLAEPSDGRAARVALGDEARAFQWHPLPVHAHDVVVSSAWAVPAAFPGRLIYVVHDLTFLSHPHCHTRTNRLHCLEGLVRAVLVAESHFVTVSRATADVLAAWFPKLADRTTVIHNGISAFWRADPGASSRMEALGLTAGAYVLCVGSLEPRKNLERLLDAHGALPRDLRQSYPLVVVGGHGWKNEALLQRLHGDEHVELLGRVSDEDLLALYNCTALFVYPSLAEGFGLPALEALACGAPVLTSNTSSLPEVVGDAAETVDPEDMKAISSALHELLRDPDRRRHLAALGPARAARFSWRAAARDLLALITEPTHTAP